MDARFDKTNNDIVNGMIIVTFESPSKKHISDRSILSVIHLTYCRAVSF